MIVKSKAGKDVRSGGNGSPVFSRLISYLRKDDEKGMPDPEVYNLLTPPSDLQGVLDEFNSNYERYYKPHSRGNACLHEMISPNPKDNVQVTPDKLYDLAREYTEKRAPNAMAFFQVHLEARRAGYRPHVHILISGNEIGRSRQTRISKEEFEQVKEHLKAYTKENYPELRHAFEFRSRERQQKLKEEQVIEVTRENVRKTVFELDKTVFIDREHEKQSIVQDKETEKFEEPERAAVNLRFEPVKEQPPKPQTPEDKLLAYWQKQIRSHSPEEEPEDELEL